MLPDRYPSAPRWRVLAALAAVVLAVHTLMLQSSPARFGPVQTATSPRSQAFATRTIAPPPALAMAAVTPSAPSQTPRTPKKKLAETQQPPAPPAIDLIATPSPEAVASSTPQAENQEGTPEQATLAIAAASAPATAEPGQSAVTAGVLPETARLQYKMTGSAKGLTYHADAELGWRRSGESYNAFLGVSALFLGSRSMESTGQIGPEGLAPTRFSDKSRSEVAAHFEPGKGQIVFSANTPTVPWIKGAQDRVSVFIQLGAILAGNPAGFPVGSTLSIYTVGPRDADTWTFRVEGEEKMTLPYGEVDTLKLTRQPRREFDQKVEIWYAPSLGYLPVRSKITQHNGDFIDQQLSAIIKA
jgi:hypothetical protein